MPNSGDIERVARAIAADQSKRLYGIDRGADEAWEANTDYGRSQLLADAAAALAALPQEDDRELLDELRTGKRKLPEALKPTLTHRPLTFMEWPAVGRQAHARLLQLSRDVDLLREALTDARQAIASLDDDALGYAYPANVTSEQQGWPIRDELLSNIDAALSSGISEQGEM